MDLWLQCQGLKCRGLNDSNIGTIQGFLLGPILYEIFVLTFFDLERFLRFKLKVYNMSDTNQDYTKKPYNKDYQKPDYKKTDYEKMKYQSQNYGRDNKFLFKPKLVETIVIWTKDKTSVPEASLFQHSGGSYCKMDRKIIKQFLNFLITKIF